MADRVQPPEIAATITTSLGEHQVLMNFNGDHDAQTFIEWWQDEGGLREFQRFVAAREETRYAGH